MVEYKLPLNEVTGMIGFEKTATLFSDSVTSSNGGAIGWIDSKSISSSYFNEISNLSSGKLFSFDINSNSKEKAKDLCIELCEKLLSNPVIENYEIEIN